MPVFNFSKSLFFLLLLLAACQPATDPQVVSYEFPSPQISPDSIQKAIGELEEIAQVGTPQDKAIAAIYRGLYYDRVSAYRQSQQSFSNALIHIKGLKEPALRNKIYKGLGNATKDLGEYPESLQMFSKALTYCEPGSEDAAGIHANIAQVFQLQDDLPQAEAHLRLALQLSGERKHSVPYLVTLHTLANVYGMQEKIDSALLLDEIGIAIADSINANGYKSSFLDNKANCFMYTNRPDSARYYFEKCLDIDTKLGDKKQVADTWLNLGELEMRQQNGAAAESNLNRSIALSNSIGYRNGAMTGWRTLSSIYAERGAYEQSLKAQKTYYAIKDSIQSDRKERAIAEWKTVYETERKEEKIRLQSLQLQQKNVVIGFGALSAALLFFAVYFANRRAKLRKEKRYQEELFAHDQEAALKILIAEETERRRIAADLHDGVGQTLTAAWLNLQAAQPLMDILDESNAKLLRTATQLIGDSCAEVRQISHNMMPTVLFQKGLLAALEEMVSRINEKQLHVSLSADEYNPDTDKTIELVLYRIIQECVNNTVRHSKATDLFISIHQEADQLAVLIEDNGLGMQQPLKEHEGIGLQNIKSRVQYLRGSVEWHPVNPDNSGTIVEIYIPSSV